MAKGRLDEAIDSFQRSLVADPHHKTAELLGECLMRRQRFGEAIVFLAAATQMNRGCRAPCLLAKAYLAIGRDVDALSSAEEALSRNPNNKEAGTLRSELVHRQGSTSCMIHGSSPSTRLHPRSMGGEDDATRNHPGRDCRQGPAREA